MSSSLHKNAFEPFPISSWTDLEAYVRDVRARLAHNKTFELKWHERLPDVGNYPDLPSLAVDFIKAATNYHQFIRTIAILEDRVAIDRSIRRSKES